jgi:hypothetical protein
MPRSGTFPLIVSVRQSLFAWPGEKRLTKEDKVPCCRRLLADSRANYALEKAI